MIAKIALTIEGFIFATGLVALFLMYYRNMPLPRRDPITVLIISAVIVFVIDDTNAQ